jgi:hypothetical protein
LPVQYQALNLIGTWYARVLAFTVAWANRFARL